MIFCAYDLNTFHIIVLLASIGFKYRQDLMPNWHLPAKSQQWNHQNKDENLFKVSNKDTRTVSTKRRSCVFIANFQQI